MSDVIGRNKNLSSPVLGPRKIFLVQLSVLHSVASHMPLGGPKSKAKRQQPSSFSSPPTLELVSSAILSLVGMGMGMGKSWLSQRIWHKHQRLTGKKVYLGMRWRGKLENSLIYPPNSAPIITVPRFKIHPDLKAGWMQQAITCSTSVCVMPSVFANKDIYMFISCLISKTKIPRAAIRSAIITPWPLRDFCCSWATLRFETWMVSLQGKTCHNWSWLSLQKSLLTVWIRTLPAPLGVSEISQWI